MLRRGGVGEPEQQRARQSEQMSGTTHTLPPKHDVAGTDTRAALIRPAISSRYVVRAFSVAVLCPRILHTISRGVSLTRVLTQASGRTMVISYCWRFCRAVASDRPLTQAALVTIFAMFALLPSRAASAQTVQIAPLGGYRFGGDLFELATNRQVDVDGAPVLGGTINIALGDGLSVEGLISHQDARVAVSEGASRPLTNVHVVVDQWLAGGRQEFGNGRARPFLSGLLGLTRYGTEGDNEVRFAVSAAGGVMVDLDRRLGLRFDGRVFSTFVDGNGRVGACAPGICVIAVDVDVVWQAEFSAGVVVAF